MSFDSELLGNILLLFPRLKSALNLLLGLSLLRLNLFRDTLFYRQAAKLRRKLSSGKFQAP